MTIQHRRFGGWLEFDRNGPPISGTPEQQAAVRAAVDDNLEYGNRFHRVMQAIDRAVNRGGRHYIPVGFYPLHLEVRPKLGFTFPTYIQLGEVVLPQYLDGVFLHEVGHMVAWKLDAWDNRSEDWPNKFRDWVVGGQRDGEVWERLEGVVGE